jgi:hypothetical protein
MQRMFEDQEKPELALRSFVCFAANPQVIQEI